MHANELTFGVEIETYATWAGVRRSGLEVGSYYRGKQVPYLPAGWIAKSDSSIKPNGFGVGCEIVSPILRGEDGFRQVIQVCKALEENGHRVNYSCGVHVHVGWDRNLPATTLARLVMIVSYLEQGIYAITGTKRRERSQWTKGIRQYGNKADAKKKADEERYHILNLNNLARGRYDAVEFRAFSGSLNATKIVGWIQVCLGIVQRAVDGKRDPAWTPKPPKGGWAKKGPGQSETERLLGYLAWGDGYAKRTGGVRFGQVENEITETEIRTEFRRLAKKYDAE